MKDLTSKRTPSKPEVYTITYTVTTVGDVLPNPKVMYKDGDGMVETEALPLGSWEKTIQLNKGEEIFLQVDLHSMQGCLVELEAKGKSNQGGKVKESNSRTINPPTDYKMVFPVSVKIRKTV